MSAMGSIGIDELKQNRTMKLTNEFRLIGAYQHPQTLGPTLQQLWVCIEDGAAEWHTVPTHWMSVEKYHAALASDDRREG